MTPYAVLGVSTNASTDEIHAAYRLLAKIHHPDNGGRVEVITKINEAYRILSHPELRRSYDQKHRPDTQREQAVKQEPQIDPQVEAYIKQKMYHEIARKAAWKIFGIGLIFVVVGLVITGIAYSAATDGGTYTVFWGLMVYGGYKMLQGLYYLANPDALLQKRS